MLWLSVVEWLARLILLLLVVLSFWSITVIIDRRRFLKSFSVNTDELKKSIRQKIFNFSGDDFYSGILRELSGLKTSDQVDKAFEALASEKRKDLEKGLPILGTLGSTTPFVGLLGTILGIIVSFGELSQGSGSTNTVMFSLAEALILTAVGLIVAIPAVVAFNYYGRRVRLILNEASSLKDLYLAYRE
jgi:biopolymer transport protein ExbB/TolQ